MNSLLKYLSFAVLLNLTISCSNNDSEEVYEDLPSLEERLHAGGETTVFLTSSNSYSTPAPNLSGTNLTDHLDGDVDFESVFVTAPATINQGLGTIFNNSSCISCHPRDGRPSFRGGQRPGTVHPGSWPSKIRIRGAAPQWPEGN